MIKTTPARGGVRGYGLIKGSLKGGTKLYYVSLGSAKQGSTGISPSKGQTEAYSLTSCTGNIIMEMKFHWKTPVKSASKGTVLCECGDLVFILHFKQTMHTGPVQQCWKQLGFYILY